jgi:hypothetical protein
MSPGAISKEISFTATFSVYSRVKSPFIEPKKPGNFFEDLKIFDQFSTFIILDSFRIK